MKAVILAGGRGTRIASVCADLPKPLLPLGGMSVLERQIVTLRGQGIHDFTIITGYLAEKIEESFGDGSAYGVRISYFQETEPLGTAGALLQMRFEDDFLLCGGDLVFRFDLGSMMKFHKEKRALATLFAHPNSHPYDSTLIEADADGRVTGFLPKEAAGKPEYYENLCNAGIQIMSPRLFENVGIAGKADLDRDILVPAVKSGRIFAYRSAEYVKDMGTPERYARVGRDIAAGLVANGDRKKQRPAVFLDRDGTVNVYKGLVTSPDMLELSEGAGEAIRRLNEAGVLVVLATNQPVIARGDCTFEELRAIHSKLETLLGAEGAYLDAIYFCPHHPDAGFPGERREFKIVCDCRKPKPGLLLRAAQEMNIDLSRSYMVGDRETDIEAGRNAGCIPVYIRNEKYPVPDGCIAYDSLLEFVKDKY